MLKLLLSAFIGSGIGGAIRFLVSHLFTSRFSLSSLASSAEGASFFSLFPWHTFLVNIVGCFIIGLVYACVDHNIFSISPEMKTFLTVGICGGLTTFSTFSHESLILFQSGHTFTALGYIILSLILGIGAAILGHVIIK
ncbi:MAG: fluoride efflux transporter FluC [Lepagella sp.]